ncbi:MAG: hypothetical protein ACJA0C_000514 [Candidatus Endobugula sp.]|jgi:hypothetical protein
MINYYDTFARIEILFSGTKSRRFKARAKRHGKREFININDRLSRFLTQYEEKMTFVQRHSHVI